MNSPQPSIFAGSLLDLLRETTSAETGASWTEADLIDARDYTLSHLFPTGLAGTEQDRMVAKVIGGDPDEVRDMLRGLVKPALWRLHSKAELDGNRQRRKDEKEKAGEKWDPDADEYDEWGERIEKTRKTMNDMIANARKSGKAVVATHDGMDGETFRKSFSFVTPSQPRPRSAPHV